MYLFFYHYVLIKFILSFNTFFCSFFISINKKKILSVS